MKKERKQELINQFPPISPKDKDAMQGKGYQNFAVMLTRGDELFVRCYHRYSRGGIVERQRYIFAKDGYCRYALKNGTEWKISSEFREPVFTLMTFGYNTDNRYTVLNMDAIKRSCMKYSEVDKYTGTLLMEYLRLYCRHPNVEYLMKQGYSHLIWEYHTGWYGTQLRLGVYEKINWKSNNLLKMLDLSKTEFALLKGNEKRYENYMLWRSNFPKYKPQDLLLLADVFRSEYGTLTSFCEATNLKPVRIARYLDSNDINTGDYRDYLEQCRTLEYNLHDTAICLPRDFNAMHTRLSAIIIVRKNNEVAEKFEENLQPREILEYKANGLILRQPHSFDEIVVEGQALRHCVGGYAERHALGKLHIMFIRKEDEPDIPYYTMEVSVTGKIRQCRGYGNNVEVEKPQSIIDFEVEYQKYLDTIFKGERVRVSA